MFAVACDGYVWVAADYVVKAGVGRGDDVADPFAAGGGVAVVYYSQLDVVQVFAE